MREAIKDYPQFKAEVDRERRMYPTLDAVDEPHFHYFADERGKDFARRYAEEYAEARGGGLKRVMYVSVPAPVRGKKFRAVEIFVSMLKELGDAQAEKREDINVKARRLHDRLERAGFDMLVITDLHNMVLAPSGKPLLAEFYYLFFAVKNTVLPIHVLFTGEEEVCRALFSQEGTITRRVDDL